MTTEEELLARVQENEELAEKFHQVDTRLLQILSFEDFFQALPAAIAETFDIPRVWFTLISGTSLAELVERQLHEDVPVRWVQPAVFQQLVPQIQGPLLINSDVKRYLPLLPEGNRYLIRSMAITPITLEGEVVATLNQGDAHAHRYHPQLDTVLLERLAVKISLSLSNVTAHERLRALAQQDPLTGLPNRRSLEALLEKEVSRAQRYGSHLSLAFLDLNRFKQVNDTRGHDVGDRLLCHVASLLRNYVRHIDIVARFAGDEFVLLLPQTPLQEAQVLLERVQQQIAATPLAVANDSLVADFCYGVAVWQEPGVHDGSQLLRLADSRLYAAKEQRPPLAD